MAYADGRISAAAALIALALASAPAAAHEFWIALRDGTVAPGAVIVADLKVGQKLRGEPYPYLTSRFRSFTVTLGGTTTGVAGNEGDIPALSLIAERSGLHVIAQNTIAFRVTYDDWAVFRRYLADEGLDSFADLHRARGLPESGFAERYTRYVKALVQVAQLTIHSCTDGGLRQTRPDVRRHLGSSDRLGELTDASIGKFDAGHRFLRSICFCSRPP